jgi:7-carboxy-7-deazaguanine synthase
MKVAELFRSIQGETTRAGEVAAFVRLAGCNLRCAWCDTPHARTGGRAMSVEAVMAEVARLGPARLACVTGGEPLLQPSASALVSALLASGRDVQVMTNGSVPLDRVPAGASRVVDVKSPWAHDPGAPEAPGPLADPPHLLPSNLDLLGPADEARFVVRSRAEFDWAARWAVSAGLFDRVGAVLVAPAWGALEPATLAAWILDAGLPLRLNLQVHKLVWGEGTRM